jgi:glutathione S-transferase
MIRWLSWGKENFAAACNIVHFERGTKQRYGLGPIDQKRVEEGLAQFRTAARILEAELSGREWLLGNEVSYADFRMATFLPYNDVAGLPLYDYPAVGLWYQRLEEIDAWRAPFNGLEAPELPPIPSST